jgi:hypothetical protein
MFKGVKENKIINPHNPNAYRIEMGDDLITYFYYGPGEYDDGEPHYGIGSLHIHPDIVDTLRKLIKIRESKVVDIVADWFSEKFGVDVDETSLYPYRKTPTTY